MNRITKSTIATPFHHWLLLLGLILIGVYISFHQGLISRVIAVDTTRISIVIILIFIGATIHAAYRSWCLARQVNLFSELQNKGVLEKTHPAGLSVAQDYIQAVRYSKQDSSIHAEVMAEQLRGANQTGWFIVGLLVKLGLLGTVIGFVMMLGTVSGMENMDVSDIKNLMQKMTQGMGVAMNTTLVGLICSMLLGLQYLLLDRSADGLLVKVVSAADTDGDD